jgi:hypothetical protein
MAHPLETARRLVDDFAPPCSARVTALAAIEDMLTYADQDLRECRDCGTIFYLTATMRAYFIERGLHEPVRCVGCREHNRRRRHEQERA